MARPIDQEPIPNKEKVGSFFETVTLGDIYQRALPNPRRIPISPEQVSRWFSNSQLSREVGIAERRAFAKEHGVEWIDDLNACPTRVARTIAEREYYLMERPAPELAHWFPYIAERQLIFRLAKTIGGDSKRPLILEAACGSGVVSKLLAAEGIVDVVGVDPDIVEMGVNRVPATPGNVQIRNTDLWDVLDEFGPKYSAEKASVRRNLLQAIRSECAQEPVFQTYEVGSLALSMGHPSRLVDESSALQKLGGDYEQESPVDIVLCNFMPRDIDLTVPLRDGIYPKAIIYVRPTNGLSGAGDFYMDGIANEEEESDTADFTPTPDTVISYNSGHNYITLTRWITYCVNDWSYRENPPQFRTPNAEVVVQVRKDCSLGDLAVIRNRRYTFDSEFEQGVREPEKLEEFIHGIKMSSSTLGI